MGWSCVYHCLRTNCLKKSNPQTRFALGPQLVGESTDRCAMVNHRTVGAGDTARFASVLLALLPVEY